MDKDIKITVGIPVYNAERFLKFAIKSVLAQSFTAFELILTDDGSSDRSMEVASSFNDPRIILLSDGKNEGIFFRLNEQIAISKGKYFVRMDADDIMFPDRLKSQFDFLEAHPDVDAIGSQAVVIDDQNEIIGLRESVIPRTINGAFRRTIFIHPTVAGKTSWFKKFGYATGVEDFDLWIRSFNHSKFQIIREPLLFYRDPLMIKFNTYQRRQRDYRRVLRANRILIENDFKLFALLTYSHVKNILYKVSDLIGFDTYLIESRNRKVIKNKEIYQDYLMRITK